MPFGDGTGPLGMGPMTGRAPAFVPALDSQASLVPCREGGLAWAMERRCRPATAMATAWEGALVGVWDAAGGDGVAITVTPGGELLNPFKEVMKCRTDLEEEAGGLVFGEALLPGPMWE